MEAISVAEVTVVVEDLHSDKAAGMDQIYT